MIWNIVHTKRSLKDFEKVRKSPLKSNVRTLLDTLKVNPYQNPLPFEKLIFSPKKVYSRRINIQHRLVYEVNTKEKTVKILSMWTHYE